MADLIEIGIFVAAGWAVFILFVIVLTLLVTYFDVILGGLVVYAIVAAVRAKKREAPARDPTAPPPA